MQKKLLRGIATPTVVIEFSTTHQYLRLVMPNTGMCRRGIWNHYNRLLWRPQTLKMQKNSFLLNFQALLGLLYPITTFTLVPRSSKGDACLGDDQR